MQEETKPKTNEIIIEQCTLSLEELQKDHDMLTAVFASIGDAVYYTDTDRRILAWNRAAEEITGYQAAEVIGKTCKEVLGHQNPEGIELCDFGCPLAEVMDNRKELFIDEVSLKAKDGQRKSVEINCAVVKNQQGELMGAVEVFKDLTRQKELERMKEEFVAAITHDLKSPLASIMGFADLLADPRSGELAPNKLEYVRHIHHSGDMLLALISNIVDVSRIEAGQMNFDFEDFPLIDFFSDLLEILQPLAERQKISLDFAVPDQPWVNGDKRRLNQVFHNLISNSLRYTPEGGFIRITAKPEGERIAIEVADSGRGIPKSEQSKLFKKFTQLKGERRGTGLGLYIVKNFLEAHGSEIRLESDTDQGAKFYFSLPLGKAPEKLQVKPARLLLVGNDSDAAQLARLTLEEAGHTVESAESGLDGLQKALQFHPDLIVLFSPLPDLEVEQFSHSIKSEQRTQNIKLVLLSALRMPEWKNEFDGIIRLPLDTKTLNDEVAKILS